MKEEAGTQVRLRRSVLYLPAANERALAKARALDCDAIIFDLEDAVSVNAKSEARDKLLVALKRGGYGRRERIVRVNALETPWCQADIEAVAGQDIQAILFPKINSAAELVQAQALVDKSGGQHLALWAMLETPKGILNADAIASVSMRLQVLVMGTSDLLAELRGQHSNDRMALMSALQHCLLVARAHGREILDGVHLDFKNLESFLKVCEQGRVMGFDGKTLIHPVQIESANSVFGVSAAALQDARSIIEVWDKAQQAGQGVAVLNGKLIENLHVDTARRVIALSHFMAVQQNTQ